MYKLYFPRSSLIATRLSFSLSAENLLDVNLLGFKVCLESLFAQLAASAGLLDAAKGGLDRWEEGAVDGHAASLKSGGDA